MSSQLDEMGPIDYLVIEFPGGRLNGKGLPLLVDLADRGIIRILDLLFIRKLANGSVLRIDLTALSGDDVTEISVFDGASSGLFDQDDINATAAVIDPGSIAGMIIYENRWAAPLATALRHGGAQMVAGGHIPVQALLASLDAAEAAS
jgi:Family of unknown function (DUF6325)